MSKYQTPYRYDFVGSFLRPQEVKQAKADYSEGKITKEECDAIVDKAVTEVVAKQKELGFHIITDGEFRRTYWHLDFMWGFEGVGHEQTGAGVQFNAEMAAVEDTYLTGKVKAKAHPFVEGFKCSASSPQVICQPSISWLFRVSFMPYWSVSCCDEEKMRSFCMIISAVWAEHCAAA